jgi:hypothetical protein
MDAIDFAKRPTYFGSVLPIEVKYNQTYIPLLSRHTYRDPFLSSGFLPSNLVR